WMSYHTTLPAWANLRQRSTGPGREAPIKDCHEGRCATTALGRSEKPGTTASPPLDRQQRVEMRPSKDGRYGHYRAYRMGVACSVATWIDPRKCENIACVQ